MNTPEPAGVMGTSYLEGRRRKPHLVFRYRVRAQIAVDAYHERQPRQDAYRVLDLGAAEGLTLLRIRELLGQAGDFDGVELSEEAIAAAPQLPADTRLVQGDVCQLPQELRAGSYDLCSALAVLEHLRDPLACVREAARMLRPGGVFVASCPNPLWDRLAGALRLVADEHHEQHMNRRRLLSLAQEAGLCRAEHRPFMWAPVGALTYLSVAVDPQLSLRIDRAVSRLPLMRRACVNQLLIANRTDGT